MKVLLVCLAVLATAFAVLVKNEQKRRYFPEEERANDHKRFMMMPDDNGKVHLVDLKATFDDSNLANISDITVYLYTQANPTDGFKIEAETFDGTVNSDLFDPTKFTVFTLHGWIGTYLSNTNVVTRDGILAHDDVNVFMVDYSRPANEFYTKARAAVPIVGDLVADFVNKFVEKYNINTSNIMLVGQSLGGQVIAIMGNKMTSLPGFIAALDPASPLFYLDDPLETRLDDTDAESVHVIHTNGGMLGFKSSIGHADYFPNGGGMSQPGCGPDLFGTCAHYRAYWYWGEALLTSGFKANSCSSYEEYVDGKCNDNTVSYMGQYPLDRTANGDFYLNTAPESPYALN